MKRRDLLKGAAAFGALLGRSEAASVVAATDSAAAQAERLHAAGQNLAIVNGRVLTMDPSQPAAEAILVNNGRIAHVGSTSDVKSRTNTARA